MPIIHLEKEAERVGKYMIRPLLSLERLSFSEKEGKVCYQYGTEAEDEELMDYQEVLMTAETSAEYFP